MNKPARIVLLFIATLFTIAYLSATYVFPQNAVVSAADPYLLAEKGVQSTSETHIIKNQQVSVSIEEIIRPGEAAPEPSGGNVALLGSSLFILAALLLIVSFILIKKYKVLGLWLKRELDHDQENY